MFLSYLILFTALCLSGIAAFYSIVGLTAIFAAAVIPIIIMGGILEIAKLVVTVWLHEYWPQVKRSMKVYLVSAVIVLMFITSMGIFGFLSKAHIEQTAKSTQNLAQVEQLDSEIARQRAIIERSEEKIQSIQTQGTGADQNIQSQIDREQQRINTAYDRIQPAIDNTNEQLQQNLQIYQEQIISIDNKLDQLATLSAVSTSDREAVKTLQALVGTRPDGSYGSSTARAVVAYKENLEKQKADVFAKIEELKADTRDEVQRLRSRAENEIDDSNKLIARLRSQLGQDTGTDIQAVINEETTRIRTANAELDSLTEEKFSLETEYRALEAEVGPVKYIAELIYDEQADKNLLEQAVRWVIILIVIVFDPLAVMMLLAATESIGWYRNEKRARESVISNPDPDREPEPDPDRPSTDNPREEQSDESRGDQIETTTTGDNSTEISAEKIKNDRQKAKIVYPAAEPFDPEEFNDEQTDSINDSKPSLQDETLDFAEDPVRQHELELYKEIYLETHKPEVEIATIPEDIYSEYLDSAAVKQQEEPKEVNAEKIARKVWKAQNPNDTMKHQESLLEKGIIDELPWDSLAATIDEEALASVDFGTMFPENPQKGDSYIRVDYLPTRLFKFNGQKWIEVDKNSSDTFTYNNEYIEHLINKIGSGEYDPELLNENERDQIEDHLRNQDI